MQSLLHRSRVSTGDKLHIGGLRLLGQHRYAYVGVLGIFSLGEGQSQPFLPRLPASRSHVHVYAICYVSKTALDLDMKDYLQNACQRCS